MMGVMVLGLLVAGLPMLGVAQISQKQGQQPITIEAEGGIDWVRDKNYYFAKTKVEIEQGTFKLTADEVQLDYDPVKDKDVVNYKKLTAMGNVQFKDTDIKGSGDKLIWFFQDDKGELTGANPIFNNRDTTIKAKKFIQFDKKNNLGSASGKVQIIDPKQTIYADDIYAEFNNAPTNNNKRAQNLKFATGKGNIKIVTQNETLTGGDLIYEADKSTAKLCQNVVITRDKNIFRGDCAIMNTKTQKSSLTADKNIKSPENNGRVKVIIKSQ